MSSSTNPPQWMNQIDCAIILGAGASQGEAGLPLDQDFLKSCRTSKLINTDGILDRFLKIYPDCEMGLERCFTRIETFKRWLGFAEKTVPEIRDNFSRYFRYLPYRPLSRGMDTPPSYDGNDTEYYFSVSFQELKENQQNLAAIFLKDIPFGKVDDFRGKFKDSYSAIRLGIEKLERELKMLIYEMLIESANDGCFTKHSIHTLLFEHFIDGNGLGAISFNYDLIADTALWALLSERKWEWNPETFYIQNFEPTPRLVSMPDVVKNRDKYIVKLHGSMNWLRPVSGTSEFISSDRQLGRPKVLPSKELTEMQCVPEIIPPITDKFYALEVGRPKTGPYSLIARTVFGDRIKLV